MYNNILNQEKTIVFHPGIGKTATSKIQEIGLKLPLGNNGEACFSPYGIYGGAHNYFSSIHPGFNGDKFNSEWELLLDFVSKRKGSTIVSTEFLIRDTHEHIRKMIESARSKGIGVKVVFSIRSYSEYLLSSYMQGVKVQWGIRKDENFLEYCRREIDNIRYPLLIDKWSNLVGKESIYLLDYTNNKNNFVGSFFNLFGIDVSEAFNPGDKVNLSMPFEIAPIIRHFDNISDDSEVREKLIELLGNVKFKTNMKETILSRVESEIIMNKYTHDIGRLNELYRWVELKS